MNVKRTSATVASLIFSVIPITLNCAMFRTLYYSKPAGTYVDKVPLLLSNSDQDPYESRFQFTTREYAVSGKVRNVFEKQWAFGVILPLIPFFGLKEGYGARDFGEIEINLIAQRGSKVDLDLCKAYIELETGERFSPLGFKHSDSYLHLIERDCQADSKRYSIPSFPEDIANFKLFYVKNLSPEKSLKFFWPKSSINQKEILLGEIQFFPARDFEYLLLK